jgi:hypothetical protein
MDGGIQRHGQVHSPVKPISPATVSLCAESNIRLLLSTTLSNLDTSASFALRCAARNRATLCSGLSRSGDDPALLPPPPEPPEPPVDGGAARDLRGVKRGGGVAVLELACSVLAVNRVASETLRGAAANRSVGFIAAVCPCISSASAGWCPGVSESECRDGVVDGWWVWVGMEASELFPPSLGWSSVRQPLIIQSKCQAKVFDESSPGRAGPATSQCRVVAGQAGRQAGWQWLDGLACSPTDRYDPTPGGPTYFPEPVSDGNFGWSSLARGRATRPRPTSPRRPLNRLLHTQPCAVYKGYGPPPRRALSHRKYRLVLSVRLPPQQPSPRLRLRLPG